MSNFDNNSVIRGYVNHVGFFQGDNFKRIFLRLSVFNYVSDGKSYYEQVNAQISCRVDKDGKAITTSSHPNEQLNKLLFERIDKNILEGMKISIKGSLRGSEQILLNNVWKNFKTLTDDEKEEYKRLAKKDLITRNQTYLYIEEAIVPNKESFVSNEKKVENDTRKQSEEDQVDEIDSDDNDPVDNDGVVIEEEKVNISSSKPKELYEYKYFPNENSNSEDLPFS